mmetsp:Transcript_31629/g.98415  ORF Transcript_31629/g.98415 Transcript_31629/m.98415 type:complete len:237 (-) Transcript_31629:1071-1781(-)
MMRCTSAMSSSIASAILSAGSPFSAKRSMVCLVFSPKVPASAPVASAHCRSPQDSPRPTRSVTSPGLGPPSGSRPPKTSQTSTAAAPPLWSATGAGLLLERPNVLSDNEGTGSCGVTPAAGAPCSSEAYWPPGKTLSISAKSADKSNMSARKRTCPQDLSEGSSRSTHRPSWPSSKASRMVFTPTSPTLPRRVRRPVKSTSKMPALRNCLSSKIRKSKAWFHSGLVDWEATFVLPF